MEYRVNIENYCTNVANKLINLVNKWDDNEKFDIMNSIRSVMFGFDNMIKSTESFDNHNEYYTSLFYTLNKFKIPELDDKFRLIELYKDLEFLTSTKVDTTKLSKLYDLHESYELTKSVTESVRSKISNIRYGSNNSEILNSIVDELWNDKLSSIESNIITALKSIMANTNLPNPDKPDPNDIVEPVMMIELSQIYKGIFYKYLGVDNLDNYTTDDSFLKPIINKIKLSNKLKDILKSNLSKEEIKELGFSMKLFIEDDKDNMIADLSIHSIKLN